MTKIMNIQLPKGWDEAAHQHWNADNRQEAIQAVLKSINGHGKKKPVNLVLQFSYYLFLIGEYQAAAQALEASKNDYPENTELLLNLSVSLTKAGQYDKAIEYLTTLLTLKPTDYVALDALCHAYYKIKQYDLAKKAGTNALITKNNLIKPASNHCSFPDIKPNEWLKQFNKKNIISFSLWGSNPRYLRGAIDNALSISEIYPGWNIRIYIDETVPLDVQKILVSMGVDLHIESPNQSILKRLSWRFKVVNDPTVGRFLIRDIDSVINQREKKVVDEWIASDYWFHVMRDWWTHTDLILAGMWGGVANILPDLDNMIETYRASAMETPNIDQWFLRDKVWVLIRNDILVHDRCFNAGKVTPWPADSLTSNKHVGQDVFAVNREAQYKRLEKWIKQTKSLQL